MLGKKVKIILKNSRLKILCLIRKIVLTTWEKYQIENPQNRTVICNNCVGSMVLHDMRLKFNSPFVNLFIEPSYYIKMLKNYTYYLSAECPLKEAETNSPYPIGKLGDDIIIHFLHYKSFAKAKEKWYERLSRIDFSKLYVIFVQQKGCTEKEINEFLHLSFNHKILLINRTARNDNEVYIAGFDKSKTLGIITDYNSIWGRRFYDMVNWKSFLELK